jgi:hypothetical protein
VLPSRDEDVTLGNFGGAEGEGVTFVFGLLACEIWPDSLTTADRMGRRSNRRRFSTWREAIETITGFTRGDTGLQRAATLGKGSADPGVRRMLRQVR